MHKTELAATVYRLALEIAEHAAEAIRRSERGPMRDGELAEHERRRKTQELKNLLRDNLPKKHQRDFTDLAALAEVDMHYAKNS